MGPDLVAQKARHFASVVASRSVPHRVAPRPTWFMEAHPESAPALKRVLRPTLPAGHLLALDRALDTPRQRARVAAARRKRTKSARRWARWTTLPGLVIGLWLGIVYDIANDGTLHEEAVALMSRPASLTRGDALITVISKSGAEKPLTLEAAATGTESPISLTFAAIGGLPEEPVAIKLMGLPESFRLTKGSKLSGGNWLLAPGEQVGVELIAPVVPAEPVVISVAAVEPVTGALKAPVKEMRVLIEPAAGPPGGKIEDRIPTAEAE
jgi:hypothetical protein